MMSGQPASDRAPAASFRVYGCPPIDTLTHHDYQGTLCNGWNFTLSHQRYTDSNGVCHEGEGVLPDLEVQWSDDTNGDDPVILAALGDFQSHVKST